MPDLWPGLSKSAFYMSAFPIRSALCLCLALTFMVQAQPARADSFLNYMFPSIFGPPDKGPKPEKTLVAPFAQNNDGTTPPRELTADERKAMASPENMIPVDQPHRSTKYIAEWASETVADAMSFDGIGVAQHLKDMDNNFVPFGKQEFQTYLATSHTLETLNSQQQRMQAFVKTEPTLLNEGNFGGVYRWLFDVPVTVSMIPSSMRTYSGKNKAIPVTQNLVVRIQVGRVKEGFKDGIAIERWTVLGAS